MALSEAVASKALLALRVSRLQELERRYLKDIRGVFTSQERLFVKKLRSLPQVQSEGYQVNVRELVLPPWWHEAWLAVEASTSINWKGVLEKLQAPALLAGANDSLLLLKQIDLSFAVQDPRVVDYLRTHSATRISGINETTSEAVRKIIEEGQEQGWSYETLAATLHDKFEQFREGSPQAHVRNRAELIALTEVGDAYGEGTMLAARDLASAGLKMKKSWLTVGDERVSDGCQRNAQEGKIPLEQAFSSGHMRPLRFPGCRCALQTHVDAS